MKSIPFCEVLDCKGPYCCGRKISDRWLQASWAARSLAAWRAQHTGRRQQVRRADVGYGIGWIVQEIR